MAAGMRRLDFDTINRAALASLPALLRRWLPDGRLVGREYTARNPRRADRRLGSFLINVNSGRWADFATGDKGGDVVDGVKVEPPHCLALPGVGRAKATAA